MVRQEIESIEREMRKSEAKEKWVNMIEKICINRLSFSILYNKPTLCNYNKIQISYQDPFSKMHNFDGLAQ